MKTQHTSNLEIVHRFVWVINLVIDRRPIVPLIVDKAAMDPQFLIVFESINQADWEALLVLSHVYVYTILYNYLYIYMYTPLIYSNYSMALCVHCQILKTLRVTRHWSTPRALHQICGGAAWIFHRGSTCQVLKFVHQVSRITGVRRIKHGSWIELLNDSRIT